MDSIRHAVGYNWVILGDDIAVAKLARNVTKNRGATVAPVCKKNLRPTVGFVLGFGDMLKPGTQNDTVHAEKLQVD